MKLVAPIGLLCRYFGAKEAIHIVKESGFDGYDFPLQRLIPTQDRKEDAYYYEEAQKIREYADSIGLPCLQTHSVSMSLRISLERIMSSVIFCSHSCFLSRDRKSTRLNSSHAELSRMPSSA